MSGLLEIVQQTFSAVAGGVPEVEKPAEAKPERQPQLAERLEEYLPKKKGDAIAKVFEKGKRIRDDKLAPLQEQRKKLMEEIADEKKVCDEADRFSIEEADQSLDRDELTETLLKLETKARIARQILQKKEDELGSVEDEIDRITSDHTKQEQYLHGVARGVGDDRRAVVVMLSQDGMHDLKLNQDRAVRAFVNIQHCQKTMEKFCDDPLLAVDAIGEICAIRIPDDSRKLYWAALAQRLRDKHPEFDPARYLETNQKESTNE